MDALLCLQKGEVFGQRTNEEAALNASASLGANAPAVAGAGLVEPTVHREFIPVIVPELSSPEDANKLRVMICGTYPIGQSNGYSRVMYYIAKYLGRKEDIKLTIYGFQNYQQTAGSSQRNDIPPTVILHDALATENPKRQGFGEKEIIEYVAKHPQDMIIIFNDMVITSALTQNLVKNLPPEVRKRFKLVSYMDQVYPYQKKQYIDILNENFDAVIAFTPYWESVVRSLGLKESIPTYYFPHGFDHQLYYPINRRVARMFYKLPLDAFVVLNLNRNQPRKRWDHTIMAWADVVARHVELKKTNPEKAKRMPILMIGTAMQGFWELLDIYEHELKKRGISMEVGKHHIVAMPKPQQMSDRDINILYSACDVGLNTCEGEGFGLCQFEHSAVGCPQVAANIGGFKEFLHNGNAKLVEAKWNYYIDKQRDGIGGYAEVGDPKDFASALWDYYQNPELVATHGNVARREILTNYRWETMVNHFYRVIQSINKGVSNSN